MSYLTTYEVMDLLAEARRRSPRRAAEAVANYLEAARYVPQPVGRGLRTKVLETIRAKRGPVRTAAIAMAAGRKPDQVGSTIARLVASGHIERVRHGMYQAVR